MGIKAVERTHILQQMLGGDQIGLAQEVERRIFGPAGAGETAVFGFGHGAFGWLATEKGLPEFEIVLPEGGLGREQPGWVGHRSGGRCLPGRHDPERIVAQRAIGRSQFFHHQLLGATEQVGPALILLDRLWVVCLDFGHLPLANLPACRL